MILSVRAKDAQPEVTQSAPELLPPSAATENVDVSTLAAVDDERAGPSFSLADSLPTPPLETAFALPEKNANASEEPLAPVLGAAILPRDTVVDVKAFAGEPFGVGKITVDFPEGRGPTWYRDQLIHLQGTRTLYPAFDVHRTFSTNESQTKVDRFECYFLFQGREPVAVELTADKAYAVKAIPTDDPQGRDGLMEEWWRAYEKPDRMFSAKYDKSGPVEDYLRSMLARRLELSRSAEGSSSVSSFLVARLLLKPLLRMLPGQPAQASRSRTSSSSFVQSRMQGSLVFDFDRFLGLLFGTESIRIAFQSDKTLIGANRAEVADRPLPHPMAIQPVPAVGKSTGATIEPIAYHVPKECFYLRCRSLSEYLWLRKLVVRWGGSFNDLISTEAVDHRIRAKIERQLSFSLNAEARNELDNLISDMALIGTDVLFQDGAALGVLFEAKDGPALEKFIRRGRDRTLREYTNASEKSIRFGDYRASFISTPDNRVRCFHATHGKYHLITTSSYIAKRFFDLRKGYGSLGRLAEFRYARSVMPLTKDDGVFIYLSDPFFRLIVGPHYRIETTRRAWAMRDWQHVYLARLAARAEGADGGSVESLMGAGLLPSDFLKRPDGSRPVIQDGTICDSLRGAMGSFLPVPDVKVPMATRSEVDSYRRFASHYRSQWRRMDPVSINIRHRPGWTDQRERVVLDVRITPYARENYERLFTQLDPPDKLQMAPVPGDVMSVEARLRSFGSYLPGMRAQHPRAYVGLRDFTAPLTLSDGTVQTVSLSPFSLLGTDYRVYAGTKVKGNPWTKVTGDRHSNSGGFNGYSFSERTFPAILSCRRTWNQNWIAWSHDKDILEEVTPQLRLEPADRPAQLRFRLGDLAASDLGTAIQALCYMHARRISALNAGQMHQVMDQFQLEPEEARRAAEELLGGRMVCPLNGEYELTKSKGAPPRWKSTAWQHNSVYQQEQVPRGYCHPFLDWLRGARMELTLDRTTLSTHVELDVNSSVDSGRQPSSPRAVFLPESLPSPGEVFPVRPRSITPPREISDAQAIQGTWKVVKCLEHGKPVPNTVGIVLQIKDGAIIQMSRHQEARRFDYRLHPKSQPKGFDFLAHCPRPCLLLSGKDDFVCDASELNDLADGCGPQVRAETLAGEDHFFRGNEQTICTRVADFIRSAELCHTRGTTDAAG